MSSNHVISQEFGVAPRHLDVGVSQGLLECEDVRTLAQERYREGVTQFVRVEVDARALPQAPNARCDVASPE